MAGSRLQRESTLSLARSSFPRTLVASPGLVASREGDCRVAGAGFFTLLAVLVPSTFS